MRARWSAARGRRIRQEMLCGSQAGGGKVTVVRYPRPVPTEPPQKAHPGPANSGAGRDRASCARSRDRAARLRVNLTPGLAVLAFALLGLTGLAQLTHGTDETLGEVLTPADTPALPALPAPKVDTRSVRAPAPADPSGAKRRPPDTAWVDRVAGATGIPARALVAYAQTSLFMAEEQPECQLSWPTLAGIGWIESGHATLRGNRLLANGRPSVPIIGPALDGRPGFAAIPRHRSRPSATVTRTGTTQLAPCSSSPQPGSNGRPTATRTESATRKTSTTPHTRRDATYVPRAPGDGWQRAILSYNHSDQYAAEGLDAANWYARASTQR